MFLLNNIIIYVVCQMSYFQHETSLLNARNQSVTGADPGINPVESEFDRYIPVIYGMYRVQQSESDMEHEPESHLPTLAREWTLGLNVKDVIKLF